MRSPAEIRFRLKQEAANLWLYRFPPAVDVNQAAPLAGLPDPGAIAARLRDTPYALAVERIAEQVVAHRLPLLGLDAVDLGREIHWRRDYLHGRESGLAYLRRIPYLDFARVGDHKVIWELSRHQHLVLLAQAYLLGGRGEFLDEIDAQLRHWVKENPFQRGINWTSALEVAFRAMSWIWVYHLVGGLSAEFRQWLGAEIYRHGCHLEYNLSTYFSPNTHLLGEAVVLHAIGRLFPGLPHSARWTRLGAEVTLAQMDFQVRADGSHFEQSAYYHLYAVDLFVLHGLLNPDTPAPYLRKLESMATYLAALVDDAGRLALFGDDDGGRLFHPYGPRQEFAPATLATCALLFDRPEWMIAPEAVPEQAAWWLGGAAFRSSTQPKADPVELQHFRNSGVVVLRQNGLYLVFKAGGFGFGGAGHSHADALSLIVSLGDEEILIDPGAYTYISDPAWRDRFRGTAAHNTIRIDGLDQATPDGPFRWREHPQAELLEGLEGVCRYRGFTHRRRLEWTGPAALVVTDRIEGPPGEHRIEQFWHCGAAMQILAGNCFRIGGHAVIEAPGASLESGWRSVAFGTKQQIPVLRVERTGSLPIELVTRLSWTNEAHDQN